MESSPKRRKADNWAANRQGFLRGDQFVLDAVIDFITLVNGMRYVSSATRRIIYEPFIKELEENLDNWYAEGRAVTKIKELGNIIPDELLPRLVTALTLSYIGYSGVYSFDASPKIVDIFSTFDLKSASLFVEAIKTNDKIKSRIQSPKPLSRLRNLAGVILNNVQLKEDVQEFIELIIDNGKTAQLFRKIKD